MQKFSTLLVDIDDTILDFRACARESIMRGFEEVGLPFSEDIVDVFTRINNELWLAIERGELTREGLAEIRFRRIFDAAGIEADGPAFEKRFRAHLFVSSIPVDGAMQLLRHLHGRYTLCAASNASLAQQRERLSRAGMLQFFDHILVSDDLGCTKPDPRFFAACLERTGADKKSTLLIGDSLTADIIGGADFGLATCWINRRAEMQSPIPTYTVTDLYELKKLL
jgi:2-haloacid dehalogenase